MQTILILFFTLTLVYCSKKVFAFRRAVRSIQCVKEQFRAQAYRRQTIYVRNLPGYRVLLGPTTALGLILPRIPVICRGNNHFFQDKHARKLICINKRQHSSFPSHFRSIRSRRLGCNLYSKTYCI